MSIEYASQEKYIQTQVEEHVKKIRQSFLNAITSLIFTLEAKNTYTRGHSQRVAKIAVDIAMELGMPNYMVEQIRISGLVHDIGKVGVREMVLNKKDRLTEKEFMHIASHSTVGERILSPIFDDIEILKIVRHHHEKYDGTGYPDGLEADNIPAGARIIAVADAYDAMTSARPYRKALTDLAIAAEMRTYVGTQFDPAAVNAFIETRKKLIKSGPPKQAAVIYS